jgi:hypothetical protein
MSLRKIMGGAAAAGLLAVSLAAIPQPSQASSHREAPLISKDPAVDNTDLYAFVSPDAPDTVTIVANYIPFQDPNGGPNFYSFDDKARYEIHIDNDGNGKSDVAYRFDFDTKVVNDDTFLYATGPITSLDDPDYNIRQDYEITELRRDDDDDDDWKLNELGEDLPVPPNNIGPRSTPNYDALAASAVATVEGGIKVFAGQRDDPFFVDLGSVFDLGGLRPFNPAHVIPLDAEDGVDGVNRYNVHSIVLQVPITELTRDRKRPESADDPDAVLGIYASASRQAVRVLSASGRESYSGKWRQVSRLGNPLINEVIIPLGRKDYWNAQPPHKDRQFEKYYLKPELAGIVNTIYPVLPDARTADRADLSLILLTGVPGVNFSGNTKADLLRLNVAIPPSAPVGQGDPLTVITLDDTDTPDLAGFPNGRRLEDDVTDIELRAVADGYGTTLNALFGLPNNRPNNTVSDGVQANDVDFLTAFPYVASPFAGYDSSLHR